MSKKLKGFIEGENKGKIGIAKELKKIKISNDIISQSTGLLIEQIEKF